MAQTIVSNTGALVRNGGVATVPKGGYTVSISEDFVYVESGSIKWKLDYKDTTLDGVTFASAKELAVALSNFSKGGGDGQGVTWEDTSSTVEAGKIPVYSAQGLLNTGTPEFPENAVPLSYFDVNVPLMIDLYLKSLPGFAAGASLQANAAGDGFEWVTA